MKNNIFLMLVLLLFVGSACDTNYRGNPNEPEVAPTYSIFNAAVKEMMDDTHDEWFLGRFTNGTMQYWAQTEYTEEDRYQYRESMRENFGDFFYNLENLRQVILLNEDPATANEMSAYGANVNQVATARIMMAWAFNLMADTWGDVPYWSYSTVNESFQALMINDDVLKPAYAAQSDIYPDLLKQLEEAADMIDESADAWTIGDPIYNGDAALWKKFANSLRLRIAVKIEAVYPGATAHITDAIADGVFTSNADNAFITYENNEANGSPFQVAFASRSDFAVSNSFMNLLDGTSGGFGTDPRISKYAQPNQFGNYVGVPNGVENATSVAFKWESLPGVSIIGLDNTGAHGYTAATQALMSYAEVEFLKSEVNGWSQTEYEAGVAASMEEWGVDAADVTAFVGALPAASEENVMTQKYVALYMQAHTAWADYRRTGFPTTLTMPNDAYTMNVVTDDAGTVTTFNYTFEPIPTVTDLPFRMEYPNNEFTLNEVNYKAAVALLSDGNEITSKLWWDVN
ncbi:SusD/RagB family nutrient-binding outer membrane lipoprotein [Marinifilum sp. N1E240]|uniref:SusD/RagB family nutrient-binding outer membrane lipoprotein n=1 Tax=Marinifilum sp. N1E240 TaxID=2608082 RepID=UPI00128E8F4C|nr:SusD/RagB family nutrient-binding outer membrane lipoprotein [Marinifilum sp. N1E240]MPQ46258.1 SusD/RagB family nutrient-binding outer membrane lipoprotein [Marinifilum sp. N1E240]